MQKEVLKCRLRQLEQQVVESYEGWKNSYRCCKTRAILLKTVNSEENIYFTPQCALIAAIYF